jgi:excisionase family DNA binding protein
MADQERLPISTAADRLGVSVDTIRRKIKRGQIEATRDNHGQWFVTIPADANAAHAAKSTSTAYAPMQQPDAQLVAALQDQIGFLRDQLNQAQADRAGQGGRITELEARLMASEDRHRAELARERTQAAEERAKLLDMVEAERQRHQLRRPWWQLKK